LSTGREGARAGTPALALPVSLYLDGARFLAAAVVCIGHLGTQRLSGGWLWQMNAYVHVALMAFFVLSGFVVAHVVATREQRPADYAASRLARLHSVVLPALLITLLADGIGRLAAPERYPVISGQHDDLSSYLASLFFLHQTWGLNLFPGSNMPYWSLGPEAMFYLAFGLSWFTRSIWPGVAAIVLAGPTIAFLFPLWLLGVGLYHTRPRLAEPGSPFSPIPKSGG
jgi:peptidoglycan/LPS O-acetylase OafA/YrhL